MKYISPFMIFVALAVFFLLFQAEAAQTSTITGGFQPIFFKDLKSGDFHTSFFDRALSFFGLIMLTLIAFFMSTNKKKVNYHLVIIGILLQLIFGFLVLKTDTGKSFFDSMNTMFVSLLDFTKQGSSFLFGNLALQNNMPVGPPMGYPLFAPVSATTNWAQVGAFFAFGVLPTIIFFSSMMSVLYHLGIMQFVVKMIAVVMQKTMKTSGAETLSAAGNIFVGQTEAPLLIKPYVDKMTRSELMAVMVGGFATIAGGVMAAYVGMLQNIFPDIAGHLLAASVMSAPASLVIAKILLPEEEVPLTKGKIATNFEKPDANIIDAAARGASDGLSLALNVAAMLLAFIAIIALLNSLVGYLGSFIGIPALSIELILGYLLSPIAFIMGIPWEDAVASGSLLGMKTVLNEFVAYSQLATQIQNGVYHSPRTIVILTYALCGFANFSSIAIQLGGIGGIAPSRRKDLAQIGLKAMIGGTLACFMTAAIAGMLI